MQGPGALRAWVAAVGLCAVCAAEACLCCLCPCAPLLPCRQACVEAGRLREQVAKEQRSVEEFRCTVWWMWLHT